MQSAKILHDVPEQYHAKTGLSITGLHIERAYISLGTS